MTLVQPHGIDLATEELLTFKEAANHRLMRRGGKACHIARIYRFAMSGLHNTRLEWVQIGGQRFTSSEAIERFVMRTTAAAQGMPSAVVSTPTQRKKQIERAESRLAAAD